MDQIVSRRLQFDRFTLDLSRSCVQLEGRDIDLSPKAFDVLRFLAENAGRLVSKQELYDAVWPGVTVTDESLFQRIRELRQVLGDDDHGLIKTVSARLSVGRDAASMRTDYSRQCECVSQPWVDGCSQRGHQWQPGSPAMASDRFDDLACRGADCDDGAMVGVAANRGASGQSGRGGG